MFDLVTFGEAMIRLAPPNFQRLEQTRSLDLEIGGAELNTAVGATRLGLNCAWVSKLPENALGWLIRDRARELGVDCSRVVWDKEGRAGLYFLEFGASPRASSVLYDRAGSSASTIAPGEVDWPAVFESAKHFHVTGITPGLSDSACAVTEESLMAAKAAGCSVSFDFNYRMKLWTPEKAGETLEPMMTYVDILVTNREDPNTIFGIREETPEDLAGSLAERFGIPIVAVTLRDDISVWRNNRWAVVWNRGEILEDKKYEIEIVDKLGGGDSFVAGFIAGWLPDKDVQKGLQYGNAFGALKHTVPGDLNWCTKDEVESLIRSGDLRIMR